MTVWVRGKWQSLTVHTVTSNSNQLKTYRKMEFTHDKWQVIPGEFGMKESKEPFLTSPETIGRICSFTVRKDDSEQDKRERTEAMQLMLTAPELLNALKVLLEEAERVAMLVPSEHWNELFRQKWNENTLIAEKAIDKATTAINF